MSTRPIIHALIPARGGSKGIPRKNIRNYRDKPLIAHSIEVSIRCGYISRTVVSTDCPEIQKISKQYGAEAPYIRPSTISGDLAVDLDCFTHYLSWLRFAKQELPDIIVHLRPTYPERTLKDLEECIKKFLKIRKEYDSLRTVISTEKSPFKMYTIDKNRLCPLFPFYGSLQEPYNNVRHVLPKCYLHNGNIDIVHRKTIETYHSMTGSRIYPYVMSDMKDLDIDSEKDWERSLLAPSGEDFLRLEMPVVKQSSHSLPIDIPNKN